MILGQPPFYFGYTCQSQREKDIFYQLMLLPVVIMEVQGPAIPQNVSIIPYQKPLLHI